MTDRGQQGATANIQLNIDRIRSTVVQLGDLTGLSVRAKIDSQAEKPVPPDDLTLANLAEGELYWRLKRVEVFGETALFGEPAWELLLELFIQFHRGVEITLTSVCLATTAPLSTALRYLAALKEAGLVERRVNSEDRRMQFVSLSSEGQRLVRKALISRWEHAGGRR